MALGGASVVLSARACEGLAARICTTSKPPSIDRHLPSTETPEDAGNSQRCAAALLARYEGSATTRPDFDAQFVSRREATCRLCELDTAALAVSGPCDALPRGTNHEARWMLEHLPHITCRLLNHNLPRSGKVVLLSSYRARCGALSRCDSKRHRAASSIASPGVVASAGRGGHWRARRGRVGWTAPRREGAETRRSNVKGCETPHAVVGLVPHAV